VEAFLEEKWSGQPTDKERVGLAGWVIGGMRDLLGLNMAKL
jgi:hypothetical protein